MAAAVAMKSCTDIAPNCKWCVAQSARGKALDRTKASKLGSNLDRAFHGGVQAADVAEGARLVEL